jgi:cell division initiation protein
MKLTPLDIRKQEFRKTLRGFDPIEVQTFLEMVGEEYEQLLEKNKQLNHCQKTGPANAG